MSQSRDIAAMACTPLSGRSGRPLAAKKRCYPLVDAPKRSWRKGSRGVAADQQSVGSAARPVVQTRDLSA
jgi:hypothetical protein